MTAITIPPHGGKDPDGMNDRRAAWGENAIGSIMADTGTDQEDALADLLGDLMHYAHQNGEDFAAALRRACYHFEAETGEG